MSNAVHILVSFLVVILSAYSSQAKGAETGPDEFLIIAHRGASGHAPENTLAAFAKALALGANVLEVDVRQTRDGHLVIMHDASVERTTDGEGDVAELTLEQLKRLDAGSWFDETFSHERIPTLTEAIDLLPDSIQIIIEIKGDSSTYPEIEKRVVALVKTRGIESRVILKSFDAKVLDHLRYLAPDIRLLFVYAVRIPLLDVVIGTGLSRVDVFSLPVRYLQPHSLFVTGSFVEAARARGFGVIAWDVHDEHGMKEMIHLGVAGIETDYPDVLRRVATAPQAVDK